MIITLRIITMTSFAVCLISFIFATHYERKYYSEKSGKFSVLGAVSFFLTLICFIISSNIPEPLNEQYSEKIKAFEKASNDLEKFLIEHPEFKLEE